MGGVFSAILLSNLGAEGPSGVTRAPKENVTAFGIANTRAWGVSEAARAKTGPGTLGADTTTTTCALATTTAGVAVATSRASPTACTAAPSTRGANRVGEGGDSNPLDDGSLWSSIGREKEGWVVNPTLVVIDKLFNLLDNVVECADCPGEIIHIEVGNYSVLGSALVSLVLHQFDKADKHLVREESNVRGEKGHFAGTILEPILGLLACDEVEESHDAIVQQGA